MKVKDERVERGIELVEKGEDRAGNKRISSTPFHNAHKAPSINLEGMVLTSFVPVTALLFLYILLHRRLFRVGEAGEGERERMIRFDECEGRVGGIICRGRYRGVEESKVEIFSSNASANA